MPNPGCRCSIFKCYTIISFICPLAFQCHIRNCSTAKFAKILRKENKKLKRMAQLFFILWIHSNIFCNFSGCRCSIFKCYTIIRFVCPLAFQCCIRNCSTSKTHEDIAKRKRESQKRWQEGGDDEII